MHFERLPGLERISVARDEQDVSGHPRRVIAGNVFALDTQEPSNNSSFKINNCNDLSASRCISKRASGLERISVQDVSEQHRPVIAGNVLR